MVIKSFVIEQTWKDVNAKFSKMFSNLNTTLEWFETASWLQRKKRTVLNEGKRCTKACGLCGAAFLCFASRYDPFLSETCTYTEFDGRGRPKNTCCCSFVDNRALLLANYKAPNQWLSMIATTPPSWQGKKKRIENFSTQVQVDDEWWRQDGDCTISSLTSPAIYTLTRVVALDLWRKSGSQKR